MLLCNTKHSHLGKNDFILEPDVSGHGPGTWIQVALRNILRHGSDCIQFCCLQNKVSYKSRHTPNTLAETAGRMGLAKQAGNCAVGMRGCLRIFVTSR